MAKPKAHYVCNSCGAVYSKWQGQCAECNEWNTITEEAAREVVPKGLTVVSNRKLEFEKLSANENLEERKPTKIAELDRVLGGGMVKGSAILLGGDPGIGKSTILLQLAANCEKEGLKVAYISGEESVQQLQLRARRLGLEAGSVNLATATNVSDIIGTLDGANAPDVLVIDSVQTMYIENIDSAPGTVAQVRASSFELIRLAKKRGIVIFLVGHVTKEGQIAGPKVLEHMVDTVLYFEGERGHQFRILRAVKNRFGGTDEIGVFEMTGGGLKEVANPSSIFLSDGAEKVSGSAVFAGIEGSRPLLVEVQALVADSYMASPRRAVVGWDSNRLAMLLAVIDARGGIKFGDKEVYLNIAGGLKISEPAADLAVCAALISSFKEKPLPKNSIFFGEIGLSGEIRPVPQFENRIKEAEKLGFETVFMPKLRKGKAATKMNVVELEYLHQLVDIF